MLKDMAKFKGIWNLVHRDASGVIVSEETVENLITNQGFDYLLDSSLHAVANVGTWYFAPFKTAFTAALGSTYAVPGGTEDTNCIEGTRQAWDEGASSSQSVTNAAAAVITADVGGMAILGIGVVGAAVAGTSSTKGNTDTAGGILLSEVASVKTLEVNETLSITYTISKA
jgi:hypothetical protein